MQATIAKSALSGSHSVARGRNMRAGRLRVVSQQQNSTPQEIADSKIDRRVFAFLLVPALALAVPQAAEAGLGKDPRQLLREKNARKAKLKEAAAQMKEKGKTKDAFADSKYSLPEESRTPNMRTLADDRLREE